MINTSKVHESENANVDKSIATNENLSAENPMAKVIYNIYNKYTMYCKTIYS